MREVVANVTSTVTDVDNVEDRQLDSDEQDAVCSFVTATCGCNKGSKSRPCSQKFTADYILSVRASCAELACHELDMAIMGHVTSLHEYTASDRAISSPLTKGSAKIFFIIFPPGPTNLRENVLFSP